MELWLIIVLVVVLFVFLWVILYNIANQESHGTGENKSRPKRRKMHGFGHRARKLRSNNCDMTDILPF